MAGKAANKTRITIWNGATLRGKLLRPEYAEATQVRHILGLAGHAARAARQACLTPADQELDPIHPLALQAVLPRELYLNA